MLRASCDAATPEAALIAAELSKILRETYRDGVDVVTRAATVTIARGRRAAQVQVMDAGRFLVSLRRNQTFQMCPEPVGHEAMIGLVRRMIDRRAETAIAA